jgi:hypothetical protein
MHLTPDLQRSLLGWSRINVTDDPTAGGRVGIGKVEPVPHPDEADGFLAFNRRESVTFLNN